jgi:hypothetical protein
MAFKIPNFSKQMGGSPFRNTGFDPSGSYADKAAGYPYSKAIRGKINELSSQGLSSHEIQKHPDVIAIKENKSNIIMDGYNARHEIDDPASNTDVSTNPYTGFGADAWNNNFTIQNGQRVDKYGNTYSDDTAGFADFQNAARDYNAGQNNVEVLDTEPVNVEEEVEPIENVVNPNAHVPSEGIQVLSGKQRRAARRVQRLRNKAAKKGGLTESQSKRLNRNIDKAQGEEVAFADRTKLGQAISKAGDALGITSEEEIV